MPDLCSFDGCPRPRDSKGLCTQHYNLQLKGKPLRPIKVTRKNGFTWNEWVEWILSRCTRSACWEWTGPSTQRGYPYASFRGKLYRLNRVILEAYKGAPVDPKLVAKHSCDNPRCLNPDHLEWATQQENCRDETIRGRKRAGYKITPDAVRSIRKRLASGAVGRRLAEEYGVVPSVISRIKTGKSWGYIQ